MKMRMRGLPELKKNANNPAQIMEGINTQEIIKNAQDDYKLSSTTSALDPTILHKQHNSGYSLRAIKKQNEENKEEKFGQT